MDPTVIRYDRASHESLPVGYEKESKGLRRQVRSHVTSPLVMGCNRWFWRLSLCIFLAPDQRLTLPILSLAFSGTYLLRYEEKAKIR